MNDCRSDVSPVTILILIHSLGISPVSRDCWKRWAKTGPNSVASSFRTLGWSSSGPKALEGFKPLRSLVTPSFETTMSSMKGADLLRNGTSIWSLLLNTSINWPINSSACSISEAVIPVLLLLLRGRIPWLSFFSDYWCTDRSLDRGFALTSPTKLFTNKSCYFLTSSLISRLKVSNLIWVSYCPSFLL